MAYHRNMNLKDHNSIASLRMNDMENADTPKQRTDNVRPLVIFSVDISSCSPVIQYLVLIGGLILFMCLYGYYQELVIYGWFDRKLSIFSTFLHFFGCSIFAQIQRSFSSGTENSKKCQVLSMGTANRKTAIFYYILLVVVKTAAQGMSNLSMTQINYPAKVLFKSANPIVTMIIGITWFRKSYPTRDYIVVILLVLGLYIFIASDNSASPKSTQWGIFFVVLSMFGSAGVPMIQEFCITQYNASIEDLLYHCYLGSTIMSFVLALINGEFLQGMSFIWKSGSFHTWWIFVAFCTFGFCGSNFSTAITAQYGALVNGISNTFRKAVTLGLSFLLFPERNHFDWNKCLGAAVFFLGLFVRIVSKHHSPTVVHKIDLPSPSSSYPMNSQKYMLLALSESEKNLVGMESDNAYIVYDETDTEGVSKVVVDPFPVV